jgi:hypothetical protein
MPVYTVHQPPLRDADTLTHLDHFKFVRDGFSFSAMLFGPLWLIRHRLWLTLVAYMVVVLVLIASVGLTGASGGGLAAIVFLFMLLFGFEANSLRRWTFSRRGWTNVGVVVGEDRESAERRFFDTMLRSRGDEAPLAHVHPAAASPRKAPLGAPDVIGLFPEPEGRP